MNRTASVLAEGLYYGEGPRWRESRLWFSDFYDRAVKSVSLAGDVRTEFAIEDQPSGLGWTPGGETLVVAMHNRCVLKRAGDGTLSVHAQLADVAGHLANDMVVDAHGGAYVGSFGFDLDHELITRGPESVLADHPTAKLAYAAPDGAVSVAADELHFPNGCVIIPDGGTLIVAETLAARLTAFDIGADGSLSNRRVWAETWPRLPDGVALDAAGAIWFANPLQPECVRVAEGGRALEVVTTSQPCFACMLGGADGRELFMLTAPSSLAAVVSTERRGRVERVAVDEPGAGRP